MFRFLAIFVFLAAVWPSVAQADYCREYQLVCMPSIGEAHLRPIDVPCRGWSTFAATTTKKLKKDGIYTDAAHHGSKKEPVKHSCDLYGHKLEVAVERTNYEDFFWGCNGHGGTTGPDHMFMNAWWDGQKLFDNVYLTQACDKDSHEYGEIISNIIISAQNPLWVGDKRLFVEVSSDTGIKTYVRKLPLKGSPKGPITNLEIHEKDLDKLFPLKEDEYVCKPRPKPYGQVCSPTPAFEAAYQKFLKEK